MISIIITSFKEPKTIGKAIESIENQMLETHETIVVAPDDETLEAAGKLNKKYSSVKTLKDFGDGKSAALNLAISKAKGEIIILTDGDVYVGNNSINELLSKIKFDKKIGAVSGNPVSVNNKNNLFGFWAYLLTEIANSRRRKAISTNKRFFCSGYLFAIRKSIFPVLPENLLSEDGFISHKVYSQNYKIEYAKEAKVYVKYPTNFKDWINQKKRSAGGYVQIKKITGKNIRSFSTESSGILDFFKYLKKPRDFVFFILLCAARIYLWISIFVDINLKKKSHKKIWKRVESTK